MLLNLLLLLEFLGIIFRYYIEEEKGVITMLVLPQKVKVFWNGVNRDHFESKGYKWIKRGDIIEVDVLELPNGSATLVKVECDFCKRMYDYKYSKYLRAIGGTTAKISCNDKECRKAHKDEIAGLQRGTINELRDFFAQFGCELLATEYNGYKMPLKFRCKCGRIDEKSLDKFKNRNQRCRFCSIDLFGDRNRLGFEFVKLYYEEQDC